MAEAPEGLVEISEGKVRLLVYDPSRYRRPDGVYEPAWSPVFYNPAMVLNRDFSVLVTASAGLREAVVLDALAGTGVRALRYCLEIPGISKCYANDIDERAYELIVKNVALNNLEGRVIAVNRDANVLMYELKRSGERLDIIDVDPYGSPAPFLRAATWAVRSGGYLGVTATDLAPLSGSKPWAGSRRYWCNLTLTDVPKIVAVRVLLGYAARVAAEVDRYVEPSAYIVGTHFVRLTYSVKRGATAADSMLASSVGYMKYCRNCGLREFTAEVEERGCRICGGRLEYLGPLWVGGLVDETIVSRALSLLAGYSYLASAKELRKALELQLEEARSKALVPYNVVQISSRLKVNAPGVSEVVECLKSMGYDAVRYYGAGPTIGTNAPYEDFVACVKGKGLSTGS